MQITRFDRSKAGKDPARTSYFDGEVVIQQLVDSPSADQNEVLAVFFSAGGRTKPHIHGCDQILHIVEGQGIVATETEKWNVSAGDIIAVPKGTWHWHGATPDSAMCHIAIQRPGTTNWEVEEKNWASGYDQ